MMKILVTLAILSSLLIQGTLGEIICEQLNKEDCAFAVSSTGKRCVLEKYLRRSGMEAYKCTTSAIEADKLKDMVETNHCIEACGLDRDTLGISSDSLLESRFTQKLCSPQCYKKCPNVIDLYFNLAAGEGVYLPKLCDIQGKNPRRGMSEIKSSGIAALGPVSGENFLGAPVESPISSTDLLEAPVESPTDYPFYPPIVSPVSSPIELADTPIESPTYSPVYPPVLSPYTSSESPTTYSPVESPTTTFVPPSESPITYPPIESPTLTFVTPSESPVTYSPIESPTTSVTPSEAPTAESPTITFVPPTESPTTYPPVESPTTTFVPPSESPSTYPPVESPTTYVAAPRAVHNRVPSKKNISFRPMTRPEYTRYPPKSRYPKSRVPVFLGHGGTSR